MRYSFLHENLGVHDGIHTDLVTLDEVLTVKIGN
jgi:hypothetical protein